MKTEPATINKDFSNADAQSRQELLQTVPVLL